jgi:hypothetical protein
MFWMSLAWGEDCPGFDAALSEAQSAIVAYRTAEADAALSQAVASVGCTPVDDAARLSALLRAYGARHFFDEDAQGADRYFAAAKALDDKTFEDDLWKDAALRVWFKASASQWGRGMVASSGASRRGWVNGVEAGLPLEVAAVPQVVRDGSGHAWMVDVPMDGVARVALVDAAPPMTPPVVPDSPPVADKAVKPDEKPVAATETVAKPEKAVRSGRRGASAGTVLGSLGVALVGTGAAVGTWEAALYVDEASDMGTALKVGNAAGWGLAAVGLTWFGVGVAVGRPVSVGVSPGGLVVSGVF